MNNFEEQIKNNKLRFYEQKISSAKLDKTVENFITLLKCISMKIFQQINEYKRRFRISSIGIDSSIDSLDGILDLCKKGNIVDTYVLIRKIRDNLFLDLFLLADHFHNVPSTSIDNDVFNDDKTEIDLNKFLDYFVKRVKEIDAFESTNSEKIAINNWYENKLSKEEKHKYIGYQCFKNNLEKLNQDIKECYERFLNEILENITIELNNYVHSNGICYLDNSLFRLQNKMQKEFIVIKKCLYELMKVFLISIFLINPLLIQTDDYVGYLELGYKPCEKYKYYIFSIALDIFKDIRKDNKELFEFLENNNKYEMYIKEEDYE